MKVTLLMAMTADGLIAKDDKQLANWTSKADKKMFVAETKKAGVIVMGLKTYLTIGRPLPKRLNLVICLPGEELEPIPNELEFTHRSPHEIVVELESRGYSHMILGGGSTINGLFLKTGLIDELWLTIEPMLFGSGLPLFKDAAVDQPLELISHEALSEQVILLKYRLVK